MGSFLMKASLMVDFKVGSMDACMKGRNIGCLVDYILVGIGEGCT